MKRSELPLWIQVFGWVAIVSGGIAAFAVADRSAALAIQFVFGGAVSGALLLAVAYALRLLEKIAGVEPEPTPDAASAEPPPDWRCPDCGCGATAGMKTTDGARCCDSGHRYTPAPMTLTDAAEPPKGWTCPLCLTSKKLQTTAGWWSCEIGHRYWPAPPVVASPSQPAARAP